VGDTQKYGLEMGTPDLKSIGPITFGPEGILFVADNVGAAIFALDLGDDEVATATDPVEVEHLDARLAALLGIPRQDLHIRDMAVHPSSQAVYLSVMRGSGNAAMPLLVRVDAAGTVAEVPLIDLPFSRAAVEDAPAEDDQRVDVRLDGTGPAEDLEIHGVHLRITRDPLRSSTVTDMAWVDGLLLVAGTSNEEFSSTLRRIPFPFGSDSQANSLEIYHVSHGQYETASPIRTFVPFDGGTSVLASYTCTPVVHFPLTDLASGTQAKGRTVAELGPMNQPLDMVSYRRDGEEYLLVSNTRHPLLKIASRSIGEQEALTQPREPVGVARQSLPHSGVSRMANVGGSHVVMLQRDESDELHLHSYSTSSL
jgi:hypothetical protein